MDSGFYWYALKRLALVTALVVCFCMLPGPRSLISNQLAYLWLPTSVESISYGTHLSLIHFCWLLGYELPSLQYPDYVEPQLASTAIVVSITCQLGILCGLIVAWRLGLHAYYLRLAALDEIAEFGMGEPEPEDPSTMEIAPVSSPSSAKQTVPVKETDSVKAANGKGAEGKKAKRIESKQSRIDLIQADGVEVKQTERIV
jgi:hypothetical protein